jgi:hypothetical protein
MSDTFEAQEIYCPECDSDYALAWSDEKEQMFVVCDCGEAEKIDSFHERVTDRHTGADDVRGYQ